MSDASTATARDEVQAAARRRAPVARGGRSAASALLGCLTGCVALAGVTGTLLYCYPLSLGVFRGTTVLIHELTGDGAVLLSACYLVVHLARVWRLKRRRVSRWSAWAALALWVVAAGTGVYGQFAPLPAGSPEWLAHVAGSLAALIVACFHGIWGVRPRTSIRRYEEL